MAKAVQAKPEPDYGAKAAQENAEDAIAATTPAPGVPPLEEVSPEATFTAPVNTPNQQTRQPYTVKNPFMLLPPGANFQGQEKTPTEQNYNIGIMWRALAADPRVDPIIRFIADRLTRGG